MSWFNINGQCKESNRLDDFYINSCRIWRQILVLVDSKRQKFISGLAPGLVDCLSVLPETVTSQRQEAPSVLLWCSNSCCDEGFKQKQERAHYDNGNQSGSFCREPLWNPVNEMRITASKSGKSVKKCAGKYNRKWSTCLVLRSSLGLCTVLMC